MMIGDIQFQDGPLHGIIMSTPQGEIVRIISPEKGVYVFSGRMENGLYLYDWMSNEKVS